jgi:type IV fimbrial biogenesis protein FimT
MTTAGEHRARHRRGVTHAAGFSIVELMIVLAIASILMTLAAPSMGTFVRDNRLQSESLRLLRMMHFARSEAVKRKTRVVLCRSADPTAAAPSCGGNLNTWTTGYLVFASGDGNNTFEAANDELLRIGMPVTAGLSVVTNSTSNANLEYNSDGTTNEGGGTARFAICDGRGGDFGRQIDVTPVGRPSLSKGSAGSPIACTSPS